MSTLGRWLAGILNAHIERHNEPVAEVVPDSPIARFYIGQLDLDEADAIARRESEAADAMRAEIDRQRQLVVEAQRPCWACGDPVGFHAFHLPCSTVAPWKPAPPEERIP